MNNARWPIGTRRHRNELWPYTFGYKVSYLLSLPASGGSAGGPGGAVPPLLKTWPPVAPQLPPYMYVCMYV